MSIRITAAFGTPDSKRSELVSACVVLKPGKALSADDLIAHCRKALASFKIPRCIEFSETELPKSGSGKILKTILRERATGSANNERWIETFKRQPSVRRRAYQFRHNEILGEFVLAPVRSKGRSLVTSDAHPLPWFRLRLLQ